MHRLSRGPRSRVFAYSKEIDAWMSNRPKGDGVAPPHRMENALMRHRALVQDLSGKIRAMKSILAKGEAIWGPGLSRNVRIGTP